MPRPIRSAAAAAATRAHATDVPGRLARLARNLWWTWSADAVALFESLDPVEWRSAGHNPLVLLRRLAPERRDAIERDPRVAAALHSVEAQLNAYLHTRTWFQRTYEGREKRLRVAYLCAEFALHESLPQYAGGLGVLAGDHLKSASDLGLPLAAVGLLYRNGYYRQGFARDGATQVAYQRFDFDELPIHDTQKRISIPLGSGRVAARVWRADVGRVPLYLLDADLPENPPALREITARLYGGNNETRIQQEILLGIGGLAALTAVGEAPTVLHLNEGHAAFAALELFRRLRVDGRLSLTTATDTVRRMTVFTTHTPVAAGHDRFAPELVDKYFGDMPDQIGLTHELFHAMGREDGDNEKEPFCMTVLALRLANHCNGVSALNGEVARRMWAGIFGGDEQQTPIGHVTNGVHSESWLAPEMRPLYDKYLKPHWAGAAPGDNWWKSARKIPAGELWAARRLLRAKLVHFVRTRIAEQLRRNGASSAEVAGAYTLFDADALTIGFARRFATYKRATLIFHDRKRLAKLLNNPKKPLQIVFSGKAHPADAGGQAFARLVHEMSQLPEFRGRIALVENYDMETGRVLTSGCDVWLNNPLRPREASGTSGMKPPLHGGINCSILDGWWPEAYDGKNGWAIDDGKSEASGPKVDQRDAKAIYTLLEKKIVPEFYQRDRRGIPQKWIQRMIASMSTVCGEFNTHRMIADYTTKYYLPAHAASL